jgi:formate hydrogenlyase transcriptional activator
VIDQSKSKPVEGMMQQENLPLREDRFPVFEEIVGSSDALRKVLEQVVKVAPTDSTVLITGETGTGKELIARAIHKRSKRSTKPFIAVNCAAIPQSLIASELFGHEKGAFTGAVQRRLGRFEAADGGTLFLDEVGELPMETQIALLRVLQEREIERIGGNRPIPVNVRVVAASNRDLEADVASEAFRQDLFYRLNVFPIQVPPLRERAGDISLLVAYLVERFATKTGKKFKNISKRTLELFQGYSWPGNIRELQNVVERSVILCDGETVSVDETWLTNEHVTESGRPMSPATRPLGKDESRERRLIEAVLAESKGRIAGPSGAAAILGIPRQTLESKIASLCINKYRFRTA